MIAFVGLAMVVAAAYQNILTLAFSLASLNLALFPLVLASFYWKLNEKAVFWSLAGTFIGVAVLCAAGSLTPETAALSLPMALFSLILLEIIFWKKSNPL
jgi:hypothetical protein